MSFEYIKIFVKGFPQFSLVNSSLSLHSILHTKLSFSLSVTVIKCPQAFRIIRIHIVLYFIIVNSLWSSWRLSRLKFHCSYFTLAKTPVFDGWDLMKTWSKRFLKARRLVKVDSACDWSLIGEIKVYVF